MTSEPHQTLEAPASDNRRAGAARSPDEFSSERQVHEPHRVGLPPLGPYLRTLWRRREFAFELSRTTLRAQHFNTAFGQLWLILNPLLLAGVYFVLVDILRSGSRGADFFAHLMAGLFAYYFILHSVNQGARSVVKGGKLILNTAFPRVLLPLAAVVTAFWRFLPTFGIYAVVHVLSGLPISAEQLWVIPLLGILAVIASGLAMIVAAVQVYFRDLSSFLPYVLRIWLYISPVLYYAREVPERYDIILVVNPLAPLLSAWSGALTEATSPTAGQLALSAGWAGAIFLLGAAFFMSREREFAVRI